jgi:hypothetical protein
MELPKRLKEGIAVLTYDKRGVGESNGVYVGPSTSIIILTLPILIYYLKMQMANIFRTLFER